MTPAVRRFVLAIATVACVPAAPLVAGDEPTKADPDNLTLIARGKLVYEQHCASCHGKDGSGATTMGKKLGVKDYTKEQSFSDADIWAVLSFIESTWPPDIRERQKRMTQPGQ